jgi:hypothetical protein
MELYALSLYIHVVGALGLVGALALEWHAVAQLRHAAAAEQARECLSAFRPPRVIGPLSALAVLVTGAQMAVARWESARWPWVALLSLVLITIVFFVSSVRVRRLGAAVADARGPLDADALRRARDPVLLASVHTRVAMVLGITYLMTTKPDASGALLAMAVAVVLGLLASVPAWTRPSSVEAVG